MRNAENVVEVLKERGILVRDCTSFGLPEYIRFSVKKPGENEMLVRALKEVEVKIKNER